MTALAGGRVPPFGHPRIAGSLLLPGAFRRWPRPSSPPGARASALRPFHLTSEDTPGPPDSLSGPGPLDSLVKDQKNTRCGSLQTKNDPQSAFFRRPSCRESELQLQPRLLAQLVRCDPVEPVVPFHGDRPDPVRVNRMVPAFPKQREPVRLKIPHHLTPFDRQDPSRPEPAPAKSCPREFPSPPAGGPGSFH